MTRKRDQIDSPALGFLVFSFWQPLSFILFIRFCNHRSRQNWLTDKEANHPPFCVILIPIFFNFHFLFRFIHTTVSFIPCSYFQLIKLRLGQFGICFDCFFLFMHLLWQRHIQCIIECESHALIVADPRIGDHKSPSSHCAYRLLRI